MRSPSPLRSRRTESAICRYLGIPGRKFTSLPPDVRMSGHVTPPASLVKRTFGHQEDTARRAPCRTRPARATSVNDIGSLLVRAEWLFRLAGCQPRARRLAVPLRLTSVLPGRLHVRSAQVLFGPRRRPIRIGGPTVAGAGLRFHPRAGRWFRRLDVGVTLPVHARVSVERAAHRRRSRRRRALGRRPVSFRPRAPVLVRPSPDRPGADKQNGHRNPGDPREAVCHEYPPCLDRVRPGEACSRGATGHAPAGPALYFAQYLEATATLTG